MTDPRTLLQGQALIVGILMLLAILIGWFWAFIPLSAPSPKPISLPSNLMTPETVTVVDPLMWDRPLWYRLGPAIAAVPQAVPIKLFTIMERDGQLVAVFNPGDATGLLYAKPGDVVKGVLVKSIRDHGVEIEWEHQVRQLEMGQ